MLRNWTLTLVLATVLVGVIKAHHTPPPVQYQGYAREVEINDWVLAGGDAFFHLPSEPTYAVEQTDDGYRVVVKYWNKYQRKVLVGSVVSLDKNNQFKPEGMRWEFTLLPDGLLAWEDVGWK